MFGKDWGRVSDLVFDIRLTEGNLSSLSLRTRLVGLPSWWQVINMKWIYLSGCLFYFKSVSSTCSLMNSNDNVVDWDVDQLYNKSNKSHHKESCANCPHNLKEFLKLVI